MMDTEGNASDGRRAMDGVIEVRANFNAHLVECGTRYASLVSLVNERHSLLTRKIDALQILIVTVSGSLIVGLFSIIGLLLHSGGKF
jgi:hypothetical protein